MPFDSGSRADAPLGSLSPHVRVLVAAAIGSALVQVLSLHHGFAASLPWLMEMFPNHSDVFYFRWNSFIAWAIGTIVGFVAVQLDDSLGALIAALTWPFIIERLLNGG